MARASGFMAVTQLFRDRSVPAAMPADIATRFSTPPRRRTPAARRTDDQWGQTRLILMVNRV